MRLDYVIDSDLAWRWRKCLGCGCQHVVLQVIGEIIGIGEEEVLGKID